MSWRFRIKMWFINRRNMKRIKKVRDEALCEFHSNLKKERRAANRMDGKMN